MVKSRSQTKQEAASKIFENADVFARIAEMSRNPNVRSTNQTAAYNSNTDADKLGKLISDDFEKQFHFVSENRFKIPRSTKSRKGNVTLKGDEKVDREVFCKDVTRIFQGNPAEKIICADQCKKITSAILGSKEIVIRLNVAEFEMVEKFFSKLEPLVFHWEFKKPGNNSTFRPVLTKCALLTLGSIEPIEYINIVFENALPSLPKDVIQKILQYANDSWLGTHVKPKQFFNLDSPKPNCVNIVENNIVGYSKETIFCKIFEPDEDGMQYIKYAKGADDDHWTSSSYNTSDMLIKEMENKLFDLRGAYFDIYWEGTDLIS